MNTQKEKYPHLTAKFGDVALFDPSRAGQKACWEARTDGFVPLGLDAAEKQAKKDPDSLQIFVPSFDQGTFHIQFLKSSILYRISPPI